MGGYLQASRRINFCPLAGEGFPSQQIKKSCSFKLQDLNFKLTEEVFNSEEFKDSIEEIIKNLLKLLHCVLEAFNN